MAPIDPVKVDIRWAKVPSDAEIAKAIAVLFDAFKGDLWNKELNNDDDLVREYIGAYVEAGAEGGRVYFAEKENEDKEKEIVGVAIWFAPGQKALGTPEQRARGWDQLMAKLPENSSSWWRQIVRVLYDEEVERILMPGVMLGAYHLQLIGIGQDHQNKGIGSKMVAVVETEARKNGMLCVLETPDQETATTQYKAMGYTVRGETKNMDDIDGQPTIVFYILSKSPLTQPEGTR
ncbi:hypothetical protein C8R47DRAFT_1073544 [Mycena vitilis]|nr:hypothetical protein C8R47DRAFT_1073544 [Mycena vitilis]